MNPTSQKEAMGLLAEITRKKNLKKTEVVVCPPFIYLNQLIKNKKEISFGAQNVFFENRGPFTGEISALMLKDLGVKYVILGHSERRKFGETDEEINKKLKTALFLGIKPIVCIGEWERDHNHEYFKTVKNQIEKIIQGINKDLISKIIFAYEPVWAISTNSEHKNATADDFQEMSMFIKKVLVDKFGRKVKMPKIIYGGSVDDKNCQEFLEQGGVDGLLVGAASLSPDKFSKIIEISEK